MSKMLKFCAFVFSVYFIGPTFATPIMDSEDVGRISLVKKYTVVTGQTLYPYIVNIEIIQTKNAKRVSSFCGGVIIGFDTVLTAGHCLYKKVDPEIIIRAGIVDQNREHDVGQKLEAKGFLIHENYQEYCDVGPNRICFDVNDIAIVWTAKEFRFGPKVKIAELNRNLVKPIKEEGYILGWGMNGKPLAPSMLQRGLVKVVGKKECHEFNKKFIIPETVMCLAPVAGKTRAGSGDSGGPFVIDGVVYGISSQSIFDSRSRRKAMDLYTYVVGYSTWMANNLLLGAPHERNPKMSTRSGRKRLFSN